MDNSNMETVVNKLSEIEKAAVRLEGLAAKQKEELSAEYEKKTIEFDERVNARTEKKLKQLTERLSGEAEAELKKMRREMEAELAGMEQEYQQNHKKLAVELVREITAG